MSCNFYYYLKKKEKEKRKWLGHTCRSVPDVSPIQHSYMGITPQMKCMCFLGRRQGALIHNALNLKIHVKKPKKSLIYSLEWFRKIKKFITNVEKLVPYIKNLHN